MAYHLQGTALPQPAAIWACQLRKDCNFDPVHSAVKAKPSGFSEGVSANPEFQSSALQVQVFLCFCFTTRKKSA